MSTQDCMQSRETLFAGALLSRASVTPAEHACTHRPLCSQVNWGPFSGKYLSTAVGTARSYIQVTQTVRDFTLSCNLGEESIAHLRWACAQFFVPKSAVPVVPSFPVP